jgi:hypothetical protein
MRQKNANNSPYKTDNTDTREYPNQNGIEVLDQQAFMAIADDVAAIVERVVNLEGSIGAPTPASITDADLLRFWQVSGAADKGITFANFKALLKNYFDTLYGAKIKYAKLSDTKSSGTGGGTLSTSTWNTRTLNTEDNDADNIVSLSSNQFTLQAGTYRIRAQVPAYAVHRHKAKLRNVTDSVDVIIGSAEFCLSSSNIVTHSVIVGEFTITATKTYEVQHRIEISNGANDAGPAWNVGVNEVYTIVEIWKIG